MKSGKNILLVIAFLVVAAGACFMGIKYGADLVRNGIVSNYPTIKNVVHGSYIEVDSSVSVVLTKADDEELFNSLKQFSKVDTILFSVPYYGRYGVDLSVRNFRVFKNDEGAVEVWLPAVTMRYCELKFEGLSINGTSANLLVQSADVFKIRKKLYAFLIPILEKNKTHQKAARLAVTKAMMFYFLPYKLNLKVYIDNNEQPLPLVPGVNQSVDDAVRQAVGK